MLLPLCSQLLLLLHTDQDELMSVSQLGAWSKPDELPDIEGNTGKWFSTSLACCLAKCNSILYSSAQHLSMC